MAPWTPPRIPPSRFKGLSISEEKTSSKKRLTHVLKEILQKSVDIDRLTGVEQEEEIRKLAEGYRGKTYAQAIGQIVMDKALEGKQWAIEMVFDRTEGKPVQAIKQEGTNTTSTEALNALAIQQLNALSGKAGGAAAGAGASDGADRPVNRLANLPKNRPANP